MHNVTIGLIGVGCGLILMMLRVQIGAALGLASIKAHVADGATLKTDGWSAYPGVPGYKHDPHVVGKMAAHIVLPWVHRVTSNLKTWGLGVYHGLRRKHLQSYLDEFVFRFNRRRTPHAAFRTLLERLIPVNQATQHLELLSRHGLIPVNRVSQFSISEIGLDKVMQKPYFEGLGGGMAMGIQTIEEVCTITARGQTTVPKAIRQAIGVNYGGKIAFRVERGVVTVRRAETAHEDPALASFLKLIENDIARGRNIEAIPDDLVEAMRLVREKVDVDLDSPL